MKWPKQEMKMPALSPAERRKLTRENCRILRPYILWRRRKDNALETALLLQIKEEEERNKREAEERKLKEEERRRDKLTVNFL